MLNCIQNSYYTPVKYLRDNKRVKQYKFEHNAVAGVRGPLPVAVNLDARTTRLKLVNALTEQDSQEIEEVKAEASEVNVVTEEN